jgi:hypothetical protein
VITRSRTTVFILIALTWSLMQCDTRDEPRARGEAIWNAHMTTINRTIEALHSETATEARPSNEELVVALEFFEALTGIRARVSYSPAGPIADVADYENARQQWEYWKRDRDLVVDSHSGRVRALPR